MILNKAIEILDSHQCDMPRDEIPDLIDAIKLGIEALRLNKEMREDYPYPELLILPGETEE